MSCCAMIRFGSLMVLDPSLKHLHRRQESREMGAERNENKKRREPMSCLTRWKQALRQETRRNLPIRPNVYTKCRHLERSLAVSALKSCPGCHPERSEGSGSPDAEILRFAQDDKPSLQMSAFRLYTLTSICFVEYTKRVEPVFEIIVELNCRAILGLLVSSQQSVGEIGRQLRMPQPSVSKHLRVLREAGFAEDKEKTTRPKPRT
jgi:hypothetical protein